MNRALRGIALLELVLATAILGVALIALAVAVGKCLQGLSSANNVQTALDIAENHFAELKTTMTEDEDLSVGVSEGERTVRGRKFGWRREVEPTDDRKILKSTFTIHWLEGGRERERSFVCYLNKSKETLQ